MLRAEAQDLVNIAESLDMALSAAQEQRLSESDAQVGVSETESTRGESEAEYSRKRPSFGLSEQEQAMFYSKIGEMQAGKRAQFHVSPDGYYIFDIENKLVYTDGKWKNPKIVRVVTFDLKDGTDIDNAMYFWGGEEDGGANYEQTRRVLESVFHEGCVSFVSNGVRETVRWEDGRRKGTAGGEIHEGNRGEVSSKESKFSLKSPVEETKDLVAVHNLTEKNLLDSLKLGGLPSPSIAIVRAESGHSKYGPISLVFDKRSIDPAIKENKVYGGDAWTPTGKQK